MSNSFKSQSPAMDSSLGFSIESILLLGELTSQRTRKIICIMYIDIIVFRMLNDLFNLLTRCTNTSFCKATCIRRGEWHYNGTWSSHGCFMDMGSGSWQ